MTAIPDDTVGLILPSFDVPNLTRSTMVSSRTTCESKEDRAARYTQDLTKSSRIAIGQEIRLLP